MTKSQETIEEYEKRISDELTGDDLTKWQTQLDAAKKEAAIQYQSALLCHFNRVSNVLNKLDSDKFAWATTVKTDVGQQIALAKEGVTVAGGNTDAADEFCKKYVAGQKGSIGPAGPIILPGNITSDPKIVVNTPPNADAAYEFANTTKNLMGETAPGNRRLLAANRLH